MNKRTLIIHTQLTVSVEFICNMLPVFSSRVAVVDDASRRGISFTEKRDFIQVNL